MIKGAPVNMPRAKRYGSNFWIVYSAKEDRRVTFYSDLEYANFLTVEMDPEISGFTEQPFAAVSEAFGEEHKTVFDMLVCKEHTGKELWEVKYSSELNDERVVKQIETQKNYCKDHDIIYQVRTEKEIYLGPAYIENLSFFFHQKGIYKYETLIPAIEEIQNRLYKSETLIIKELLDKLSYQYIYPAVAEMYYSGQLAADIKDQEIFEGTVIRSE